MSVGEFLTFSRLHSLDITRLRRQIKSWRTIIYKSIHIENIFFFVGKVKINIILYYYIKKIVPIFTIDAEHAKFPFNWLKDIMKKSHVRYVLFYDLIFNVSKSSEWTESEISSTNKNNNNNERYFIIWSTDNHLRLVNKHER